MNILLIHPHDIYSVSEPWTRRIKSIADELVKKGHSVRLAYFSLSRKENDLRPHFLNGYEIFPLNRYVSPLVFLKNTSRLIKLAAWSDIVHFQKCHHYAALPAVIAAYFNKKHLHYDWDDWEEMIWYESCGLGLNSRFIGFSFRVLERFLPVLSDTVSVASEHLEKLALSFGVKKENLFPAPVGADLEQFNPTVDGSKIKVAYKITGLLVLYIGQLHGAQHIDLFIQAANEVLRVNSNVFFMIVGEGFMEGGLRKLAVDLGIGDKIIFTGAITHQRIPEFIAASDICVASFRDTPVTRCKSPLKIVEYLASGKAIVASNVAEARRMVGGAGLLVSPGNFYDLADGIVRLLGDEVLRNCLGKFARRRAERRYNWTVTAASLISAYRKGNNGLN